jgi:hypothetical protein
MSDRRPLATPTEVTLANWRCRGMGPRYVKAGTRVGYRWSDVEAWLTKQTRAAA